MNKPIIDGKERRAVAIELRMDGMEEGQTPMMRGHAAVFDSASEILQAGDITFREIIKPGAFAEALIVSDCRALFNHNPDNILGRTSAGTLRINESDKGLAIEIDPPDTMCSRDLQISMQRGDVREMSFGFTVAKGGDKWTRGHDGIHTRTISKVERLYDVSPVTYPAYPDTDCALRSLEESQAIIQPTKKERSSMKNTKSYRDKFDAFEGKEFRVDMGWCGQNTIGTCTMCNQAGCCCPGCVNVECCNMQMAADGGACTKCMKPGCCCLTCPNTDKCTLLKTYSM
jgi:HK97 family phage prohead protease